MKIRMPKMDTDNEWQKRTGNFIVGHCRSCSKPKKKLYVNYTKKKAYCSGCTPKEIKQLFGK